MKALKQLTGLWSATQFDTTDLSVYANHLMTDEVRNGVRILSILSLVLLLTAGVLYHMLGFDAITTYTFVLLAALALHVFISSRAVNEMQSLYLLAMTLLIVSGAAFVLLAHFTGHLHAALLASVVLLFIVVPIVPWGLREATIVTCLIYAVFTLSTLSVNGRFEADTLWVMQFLMLGASLTTLAVVARNVGTRKHDIMMRFELENAHRQMENLSYKDPLTGAWNRRFLELNFDKFTQQSRSPGAKIHFGLFDVDNFKQLNDRYGHDFGDRVLQQFSDVINSRLDDNGYLIRAGGDEFVLLIEHADPESFVRMCCDSLNINIAESSNVQLNNAQSNNADYCTVQISAGLVAIPERSRPRLGAVYKEADHALYSAKKLKGNRARNSNIISRVLEFSHEHVKTG